MNIDSQPYSIWSVWFSGDISLTKCSWQQPLIHCWERIRFSPDQWRNLNCQMGLGRRSGKWEYSAFNDKHMVIECGGMASASAADIGCAQRFLYSVEGQNLAGCYEHQFFALLSMWNQKVRPLKTESSSFSRAQVLQWSEHATRAGRMCGNISSMAEKIRCRWSVYWTLHESRGGNIITLYSLYHKALSSDSLPALSFIDRAPKWQIVGPTVWKTAVRNKPKRRRTNMRGFAHHTNDHASGYIVLNALVFSVWDKKTSVKTGGEGMFTRHFTTRLSFDYTLLKWHFRHAAVLIPKSGIPSSFHSIIHTCTGVNLLPMSSTSAGYGSFSKGFLL